MNIHVSFIPERKLKFEISKKDGGQVRNLNPGVCFQEVNADSDADMHRAEHCTLLLEFLHIFVVFLCPMIPVAGVNIPILISTALI
jgi:hypothetical protein